MVFLIYLIILSWNLPGGKPPTYEQYSLRDGLSQSVVRTIAEDSIGTLWLGTMDGLNRWDGQIFYQYQVPEIPNSFINHLLCTDTLLFIATSRGMGAIDTRSGEPLRYHPLNTTFSQLSNFQISHLQLDSDSLWISGEFSGILVMSVKTGKFRTFSTPLPVRKFIRGDTFLFVSNTNSESSIIQLPSMTEVQNFRNITINSFLQSSDSVLLAATQEHGLMIFDCKDSFPLSFKTLKVGNEPVLHVSQGKGSSILLSTTRSGIFSLPDETSSSKMLWLNEPNAGVIFKSRSGEIFIGTSGRGFLRLATKQLPIQQIKLSRHTTQPHIWSLSEGNYSQIFASSQSGIFILSSLPFSPGLTYVDSFTSLLSGTNILRTISTKNSIYALSRSLSLYKTNKDGILTMLHKKVRNLFQDASGDIAILDSSGKIIQPGGKNDFINTGFPDSIVKLVKRVKYAGNGYYGFFTSSSGFGISHPESGKWWFGSTNSTYFPLTDNIVYDCISDQTGRFWIATNSGLTRWNLMSGEVKMYRTSDGLPSNLVYTLVPDHAGFLWSGTGNGLLRIDARDSIPDFLTYRVNGQTIPEDFMAGAGILTSDSTIWMEGSSGIIRFLPQEMPEPSLKDFISIHIFSDKLLISPISPELFEINNSRGQIQFSVFGHLMPDFWSIQKTVRLLESDQLLWESAHSPVVIGSPGPGKYRVELSIQYGGSQRFSTFHGSTLNIQPFFWQTYWFIITTTVVFAGLLFILTSLVNQRKTRQLLERQRIRLEEQELLRRQVAQDFHDELGHQLSKIALQSQLIAGQLDPEGTPESVKTLVKKVGQQSVDLYSNLRDLIWSLYPGKDSFRDLIFRIKDTGDDFFYQTGIQFFTEGSIGATEGVMLTPEQKRHLLLIAKESMTNALRHSGCSNFIFRYHTGNPRIMLSFSDNGKGFNTTANPGTGLSGIKTRVQRMAGTLDIQSGNSGTLITITLI